MHVNNKKAGSNCPSNLHQSLITMIFVTYHSVIVVRNKMIPILVTFNP